jgi:hypothetical protein
MSAADIPRMYKDLQMRSAIVSEKERALTAKRQALAELRQHVQQLADQCQKKQQQVHAESAKFQAKKQLQDVKWGERHRHDAAEVERLQVVEQDEQTMAAGIAQMERDTADVAQQLADTKGDAAVVEEAKGRLAALATALEADDSNVAEFERAVAKLEADLGKRQQRLGEQLPAQFALPTAAAPAPGVGMGGWLPAPSDIGGESIMLVDEHFY